MSAVLIDGRALANAQFARLSDRIAKMERQPRLTVVTAERGKDDAFVRAKQRQGEKIGIDVTVVPFPDDISVAEFRRVLNTIVRAGNNDGIVVQLPLPEMIDASRHALLRVLPEMLDVDCLSERWLGRMLTGRTTLVVKGGQATLLPPVAAAVAHVLEEANVDVHGMRAVVVGWGDLVGKPVATWLLSQGATVTVATTSEANLAALTCEADIVVSGAGHPGLITGEMVKAGAVVIDAGTSDDGGSLRGDVDRDSVFARAGVFSPSPGGIGPLTLAALFTNVVAIAQARRA